jgi:hypothetical protein
VGDGACMGLGVENRVYEARSKVVGMKNDKGLIAARAAPRCTRIKSDGERCKQAALVGVNVCRYHGGTLPNVRRKSEIAKVQREFEKSELRAIKADDPEARGDMALSMEIRRTVAWIRFCEDRIAELIGESPMSPEGILDADALSWGVTERQSVGASEFPGINTKEAAGVNVWEEKLRWNRAHLAALTKQWINAGFEARRLELASRTLDVLEKAIDSIVRDLGHNPRDAEIRRIVRDRLAEAAEHDEQSDTA